jgi:transcriptional regulator with XRE-family HTH domain
MPHAKNRIKELRRARGITAAKLAKMIGTSAPHMSRLEKGQSPLSLEWITKLSKTLDVGSHEIIDLPRAPRAAACDDALLGSVLSWLLEASDASKLKLSRQELSQWASFVYKEAVEQPLDFKRTRYLATTVVKILKRLKK